MIIDADFLESFGRFYIPVNIWDSLARFSVWIEPSLVNEWAALMRTYTLSNAMSFPQSDLLRALTWEDPRRTTSRVRNRVNTLLENENVSCCWSGKKLVAEGYAIDHAMPFSRWPNNDLWNLLPTKTQVNTRKSDKLPSSARLQQNRQIITDWWQQGWSDSADEFFVQVNLALPNLPASNRSFSDVFEAMTIQRDRLRDSQQLEEW